MKKTALIIASLFLIGTKGFSQNANNNGAHSKFEQNNLSPDERIKKNTDRAEKDLGLNAEQKTKWEAATRERVLANEPLRLKMEGSTTPQERKELHQQMKVNNDKFDIAVSTFLTPDQKAIFDTKKKQRRGDRKGHMGKNKGKDEVQTPVIKD